MELSKTALVKVTSRPVSVLLEARGSKVSRFHIYMYIAGHVRYSSQTVNHDQRQKSSNLVMAIDVSTVVARR